MMHTYFKKFMHTLRYIFAPPFCAHCKQFLKIDAVLCSQCLATIAPIVSHTITLTKTKSMKVFAITDYKEPLRSLIIAKKWSDHIASTQLGELIWQHTHIRHVPIDYFVPIPLHTTRFMYRGFNQAQEIAHVLGIHAHKPVTSLLSRKKRTVFQSTLTHIKRQENVKDIFAFAARNPEQYRDKHIVLVDDLITTGATLKSAAKELLKLKPASISAVVGCRVV